MAEDLSIDTQQLDPEAVLVSLAGELELANCGRLRELVVSLLAEGKTRIILDLGGLSFVDSSGIGVIIGALKRARERQGTLRLVCSKPSILRVFEITGLTGVLSVHATREEAQQALGEGESS